VGCQKPVFFDRGLFDGEAYYIADGLPIPPVFNGLKADRYMLALLIEELPFFDNNGIRFEDLDYTRRFTPIVENCYTSRGVAVERVPAMPPDERTDFVVKIVEKHVQRVGVAAAMSMAPANLAFAG